MVSIEISVEKKSIEVFLSFNITIFLLFGVPEKNTTDGKSGSCRLECK